MQMKKNRSVLYGIAASLIVTLVIMVCYLIPNYRAKKIDISGVEVLENTEQAYFYVDKLNFYDHGIFYISAAAYNGNIDYDYTNWVGGPGNNVYKKCSVVLVSKDGNTAYQLRTYPHGWTPENPVNNPDIFSTQGIVAYGDIDKVDADGMKAAVLFETLEGKEYLIYPEEAFYVEK